MARKPLNEERQAKLAHLHDAGWSDKEIAGLMGISAHVVSNYMGEQRKQASKTTPVPPEPAQVKRQSDWRDELFAKSGENRWVVWSYIMQAGKCTYEHYDFCPTYDDAFQKAKAIMQSHAADFRSQTLMQDKGASDIMHATCGARYHARKMMGIQIMGL